MCNRKQCYATNNRSTALWGKKAELLDRSYEHDLMGNQNSASLCHGSWSINFLGFKICFYGQRKRKQWCVADNDDNTVCLMGNVSSGHLLCSLTLTEWSEPTAGPGELSSDPGLAPSCCDDYDPMPGCSPFDSQRSWSAWTVCWPYCAHYVCQRHNTNWLPSSPLPSWRSSWWCHSSAVVQMAGGQVVAAGRHDAGCRCHRCSCRCQRPGCQSCCWRRQWCGGRCCCWWLHGYGSSQTPARRWQGWLLSKKKEISTSQSTSSHRSHTHKTHK